MLVPSVQSLVLQLIQCTGEYENVEGDAEAESDAESALPGASKKHEGDKHDESCDFDVACANDDSQDADLINKNRPLSAARPANGAPESASRARQVTPSSALDSSDILRSLARLQDRGQLVETGCTRRTGRIF